MKVLFSSLLVAIALTGCFPLEQVGAGAGQSHFGYRKTGQVFSGKMSWYSVKTNGGTRTASGERFTDSGATAAHRSLPFGTMVKVTNLKNEKSEIVRINDRGPLTKGRVIDVSIGTARKLDFVSNGVVS